MIGSFSGSCTWIFPPNYGSYRIPTIRLFRLHIPLKMSVERRIAPIRANRACGETGLSHRLLHAKVLVRSYGAGRAREIVRVNASLDQDDPYWDSVLQAIGEIEDHSTHPGMTAAATSRPPRASRRAAAIRHFHALRKVTPPRLGANRRPELQGEKRVGKRTDDAGSIRAAFRRRLSDPLQDRRNLEGARRFAGEWSSWADAFVSGLYVERTAHRVFEHALRVASRPANPERRLPARAAALAVDAARELIWGDRTRAIVVLAEARRLAEQSSAEPLVGAWTDIGKDVQVRVRLHPDGWGWHSWQRRPSNGGGPSGRALAEPSDDLQARRFATRNRAQRFFAAVVEDDIGP